MHWVVFHQKWSQCLYVVKSCKLISFNISSNKCVSRYWQCGVNTNFPYILSDDAMIWVLWSPNNTQDGTNVFLVLLVGFLEIQMSATSRYCLSTPLLCILIQTFPIILRLPKLSIIQNGLVIYLLLILIIIERLTTPVLLPILEILHVVSSSVIFFTWNLICFYLVPFFIILSHLWTMYGLNKVYSSMSFIVFINLNCRPNQVMPTVHSEIYRQIWR